MKCVESNCSKEATKTFKGNDGIKVRLCEEHYKQWNHPK